MLVVEFVKSNLLMSFLGVLCLAVLPFWTRINIHLAYHGGNPISAFQDASLFTQLAVIFSFVGVSLMLYGDKIRFWWTYITWSQHGAEFRERIEKADALHSSVVSGLGTSGCPAKA